MQGCQLLRLSHSTEPWATEKFVSGASQAFLLIFDANDRQKTSYVWPLLRLRWHCLSCRGKGALFAVDIQLGLLNVNTPSAGVFYTKIRSHLGDSMINILCFLRSYYATWQWLYIALINFNLTSNLKKIQTVARGCFRAEWVTVGISQYEWSMVIIDDWWQCVIFWWRCDTGKSDFQSAFVYSLQLP